MGDDDFFLSIFFVFLTSFPFLFNILSIRVDNDSTSADIDIIEEYHLILLKLLHSGTHFDPDLLRFLFTLVSGPQAIRVVV